MAPKGKKGKKGKPSLGDWGSDGEEDSKALDPIAAAAKADNSTTEAASQDSTQAKQASGRQPKSKQGKKSKGKKALGDWSDAEVDGQPLITPAPARASSDEDQTPAARSGSGGDVSFANLPDQGEESDRSGATTNDDDDQDLAAADVSEDDSIEPVEPVTGVITKVAQHGKSDKLKVCQVDVGVAGGTLQVVTNSAAVKEGIAVVVAPAGCTMPGSGTRVESAAVRGIASSGMLCCAYDLGWADEDDGRPAYVPPDVPPGTPFPDEPYAAPEPESSELQKRPKMEKEKKKCKKASVGFASLSEDDDEPPAVSEDAPKAPPAAKVKGKKSKKAAASIVDGASDSEAAQPPAAESDDEAELAAFKSRKPMKSSKKSSVSFSDPPDDSNAGVQSSDPSAAPNGSLAESDEEAPLQLNGKKKKKTKKSVFVMPTEFEGDSAAAAAAAAEPSEGAVNGDETGSGEDDVAFGAKKKKKKSSSKKADLDDAFAALDLDAPQQAELSEGPPPEDTIPSGSKKGKKKKGAKLDWSALEGGSSEAAPDPAPFADNAASSAPPPAPEPAAGSLESAAESAPARGKGGKTKQAEEDIDALMAELDAPLPPPPVGGGKKKKKKKAAAAEKQAEEEDLDALLSEFGAKPPPASEPEAAPTDATADLSRPPLAEQSSATEPADVRAEAADEDAGDGKEMSAAAKKKAKRKAKDKAKKEGGEEPAKPAAGKAPKVNARVRAMQELQELRKREEEEARIAEEERAQQEAEAERAEAEAAAAKATADEARREARAAHRAQLKKEGKLLTGKAKKEAERLAAMREQLLARADISLGDADKQGPKKKVVYARKKPSKKPSDTAAAEAATEAEAEEARLAEEQEAARKEKEVADAKAKAEVERLEREAAKAAAAEEAAAEAESSQGEDWDAVDVDTVEAPAVKEQRLKAEKEEAQMRAAEAAEEEEINRRDEAEAAAAADAAAAAQAQTAMQSEAASSTSGSEDGDSSEGDASESASGSGSGDEDSSDESDREYSSSYESEPDEEEERDARIAAARAARDERIRVGRLNASETSLRSPICCILGHVDTGKTKILDNVRRTNVQDGEAGGITQQIGATYVPGDNIRSRTEGLRKGRAFDLRVPGLLIIDTPGHESFTNLRSRGSSLCDIAILVVDLMHGLEPQTIESINLLKQRKTPFIIALNKVDRLFDWNPIKDSPIQHSLEQQKEHVQTEFRQRFDISKLNLNEQGLNVALYWENTDPRRFVNIVPTSAITGEGIPDLLQLLVKLTQSMMVERLKFVDELQATVLEVKVIEGLGTTMDVVLVNGLMREGSQIVVCGLGGAIVTTIRSLLTPHPMKELRVKGSYIHHKEIKAAQGLKIAANGLENAVAGTQLLVVGPGDNLDHLKEEVMSDMADIFSSVDKGGEGVCVQASTLGSLEALLTFLQSDAVQIPVSGINIGPIHKKDVMRASVMLEKGARKFAVILAFDVPVNREARDLAESMGIRIFTADIIYHLFDQFQAYLKHCKEDEKEAARLDAVFPCILNIVPNGVFNSKDPIVLGVEVSEGICKVGTPLCVPSKGGIDLGRIASIENNKKAVEIAKRGQTVAIKIEAGNSSEAAKLVGRHFDENDALVSRISRKSINLVKEHFRDDLTKPDWNLMVKLKTVFEIV